MFAQLNPGTSTRRRVLATSLTLHGLFLAWLLHSPEPRLLQPSSIALGSNGRVLTRLYFPTPSPDDSATSSPANAKQVYRHERVGHEKLTWKPTSASNLSAPRTLSPSAEDKSETATLSKLGHGAAAGLPYGSLPGGPIYGDEIRPALPIATADPLDLVPGLLERGREDRSDTAPASKEGDSHVSRGSLAKEASRRRAGQYK